MAMATKEITLAKIIQGTTMATAIWDTVIPHIISALHTRDITLVPLCTPETTMVIIWAMPIRTVDTNFLDTMGMQYILITSFVQKSKH